VQKLASSLSPEPEPPGLETGLLGLNVTFFVFRTNLNKKSRKLHFKEISMTWEQTRDRKHIGAKREYYHLSWMRKSADHVSVWTSSSHFHQPYSAHDSRYWHLDGSRRQGRVDTWSTRGQCGMDADLMQWS